MNTAMGTADVETPRPRGAGIWVAGLGNTDPNFLDELVGRKFADKVYVFQAYPTESLTSLRTSWRAVNAATLTPEWWLPHEATAQEAFQAVSAVSATVPARNPSAEARFKAAFRKGREERFEDGMESDFSNELESLVRTYGPNSKQILARLLEDRSISDRVWGEAMRCLGRLEDPGSHGERLWVLEKGLSSDSEFIRDGAALGLASLDDLSAIPYLERAIESEALGALRSDMQEVLSQLTRR
jgi:hypothetical protein